MPFNTTTTHPLTAAAKVTVEFKGLLLLKPDGNNGCEIGIHRFSSTHMFQVILIVRKPERAPTLVRLVTGPLTRPFAINVTPPPCMGVQAFAPTPEPFDRSNPNRTNNNLDFRWAINMRTPHPNADFNDGAHPVATMNAGILYTPTLSRTSLDPRLVPAPTTADTPQIRLRRFSANLAAAICLPADGQVDLSWEESGELKLPRPSDPEETTYTISLLNEPPAFGLSSHDELDLYYSVLQVNGEPILAPRYHLDLNLGNPSTDEIPCMPIVLN